MTDWTIVIAGNGDAAAAAERAMILVRQLEQTGHHIAHGSCTTGDRRSVVHGGLPRHLTPMQAEA
jgi:hypothetical protein